MSDGFSWFQPPGRTPTLADLDHKPFLQRHFWPPSALGIIVISVVVSMLVGFVGAAIYTSSDNAQIAAVDPTDQARVPPTVPPSAEPQGPTTTKPPEILNIDGIAKKAGPSVWAVSSLDEAGRPVDGSGFIAGSFGGQTYILTSLSIVRAATRIPGPEIVVRNGGSEVKATLWTWQEDRDLALLVTGRTAPSLPWADQNPQAKAGDKIYLVGSDGAPVAGVISNISDSSIQHNALVDARRQGAPLLNEKGQVLGMASLSPAPGAIPSNTVFYAVPIDASCERVLTCGGGNASIPTSTVAPTGNNATTTPTTAR
ncbi:MAG: serine protease [Actinomycetota bacterium]|nr:serine protease [Actinomycetota bacterium]